MDPYKKDIARNIIALTRLRQELDPQQVDDGIFRAYFTNTLAPSFKSEYGMKLSYGKYESIIKRASAILWLSQQFFRSVPKRLINNQILLFYF